MQRSNRLLATCQRSIATMLPLRRTLNNQQIPLPPTRYLSLSNASWHRRHFSTSFVTRSSTTAEDAPTTKAEETDEKATAESSEAASPEKQKAAAQEAKIAELTDLYRRALAEQENIRQRSKREIASASTFAIQKLSSDLLTVADTLELALVNTKANIAPDADLKGDNLKRADSLENLRKGVELTLKTLTSVLGKHGISSFDPIKQPFDFNTMNAMFEVPATKDCPANHVFQVVKKGYMLNNRVLRAAQVGVTRSA